MMELGETMIINTHGVIIPSGTAMAKSIYINTDFSTKK